LLFIEAIVKKYFGRDFSLDKIVSRDTMVTNNKKEVYAREGKV